MKKTFIFILALLFIVCGCAKEEEKQNNEEGQKVEEVSKENKEENNKEEENKEEQREESKKEETSNNTETKKEESTKKPTTNKNDTIKNSTDKTDAKQENTTKNEQSTSTEVKKEEPVSKAPTLGANEYYSVKTGQVHKYTFTYPDKATCVKKGDDEPYNVVMPVKPYVVFGCEEIKDANGNILWGEYFYSSPDESAIFYW